MRVVELTADGIEAGYGHVQALRGVSVSVGRQGIVSVLGANGAGKTTLLKTIAGLIGPTRGKITYRGVEITRERPDEVVRHGIALVPEGRGILTRMTVLDNLRMGAYCRGDDKIDGDIEEMFDRFPILRERQGQYAGTLSGGQRQVLSIARALMSGPSLLLLDEPSMGLAPKAASAVFSMICEIHAKGTAVLLVEQNAVQALKISAYAYVLESGRGVLEGNAADLLNDMAIQKSYL
jgi:branched-chain amino acid transport system ATP-binding protein